MLRLAVCLAAIAIFSEELSARTFYVAPHGSDEALGHGRISLENDSACLRRDGARGYRNDSGGIYNEQIFIEVEGNEEGEGRSPCRARAKR